MAEDGTSLHQRIAELEEIHKLAQSLTSIVGVVETLEAISGCCLKLCHAERASIVLFAPTRDEPVHTIVRSSQSKVDIPHALNALIAGWILTHNRILQTKDIVSELNIQNPTDVFRELGPALAIPLNIGGKPIGSINLVNSRGGKSFSDANVRLGNALAPVAAQFILRAKMQELILDENRRMKAELAHGQDIKSILGESPATRREREIIERVAPTDATVLLLGETGTGKELAAQALHLRSRRVGQPFVAVNCAAIPSSLVESELFGHEKGAFTGATSAMPGKFELANGGTLFLDEISAMPLELQPKLLRALETRTFSRIGSSVEIRVDVRVIAATNMDLDKAVQEGRFRDDLYHRLNVIPLHLSALRERREDIPQLAQSFLSHFSISSQRFSDDALKRLAALEWRGNVRELRNTVERISIFVSANEITADDLIELGIGSSSAGSAPRMSVLQELLQANRKGKNLLEQIEKDLVEEAFRQSNGNVSVAAKLLGIERHAFLRRLQKYGLGTK